MSELGCYFCARKEPRHWHDCPVVEHRMSPSHPFFKMAEDPNPLPEVPTPRFTLDYPIDFAHRRL